MKQSRRTANCRDRRESGEWPTGMNYGNHREPYCPQNHTKDTEPSAGDLLSVHIVQSLDSQHCNTEREMVPQGLLELTIQRSAGTNSITSGDICLPGANL